MATNHYNQQLGFLQDKIREIGSAIFFNLSDSVLKLPTSIISTLKVDDYGYVWFFVQKPRVTQKEFETEFPVRLDFFRKGTSHFLQVSGKGFVVNDPEEINAYVSLPQDLNDLAEGNVLLVKVKILKADYFETRSASRPGWWQSMINTVNNWFGTPFRSDNNYFPAS